ncbi:MAG: hypothetical protein ACRD2W_15685 [Acidimicrobiales bacterium]
MSRSPSRRSAPAPSPARTAPVPTALPPTSVPYNRVRSELGARQTAIAFAAASQNWLYLKDDDIDRSVRAIATASAAPTLSRETVAELRAARDALAKSPGRVWWIVRPLASRMERFDPGSARVVVWTVTVLSAADVALPQADWMRVTVDLVWEGDGWRLQAINDVPGPTPIIGTKDRPWQPEPFDDALGGFERISPEPAR